MLVDYCWSIKRNDAFAIYSRRSLTIGIQNSYILQEKCEPHLSDKARCSETSRFSITKMWYA